MILTVQYKGYSVISGVHSVDILEDGILKRNYKGETKTAVLKQAKTDLRALTKGKPVFPIVSEENLFKIKI